MNTICLDALVDQHGTALFAFCRRLTGNTPDAEDLYQEAWLKAVRLRQRIDGAQNPKSYLFSIAINTWRQNRRLYARRQRIAPSVDAEASRTVADETDIEGSLIAQETKEAVKQAVAALHERHRLPLYLHYTAGMSIDEIATTLHLPSGTIKSRMHKARSLVKKQLEETTYAYTAKHGQPA